jgi:phytoene/squalene synthetase
MMDTTAALARSITWDASKQTYYTAGLMADKDLVNDCYRAYAYFRWVDDVVDESSQSSNERVAYISRQKELIDRLYRNDRPSGLAQEEEIIADLIDHDTEENSGLQSFIRNFLAVIEFDAHRKGRLISHQELTWYSRCLGRAVTDCVLYFVGNGRPYPNTDNRFLGPIGAHVAHMLRDMLVDTADGFINIPREYLEAHGISPQDVASAPYRAWVRSRVDQARQYFREGKHFFDQLDSLRRKIVGYWYCARFEGLLSAIERDGYVLRSAYDERRRLPTLLRITWLGASVTLRHLAQRRLRAP